MTFGSLFAGIGGFDLGFERAGLSCAWQVEINEYCRQVLAKHRPHVRRHDDIRTFPPDTKESCRCGGAWKFYNIGFDDGWQCQKCQRIIEVHDHANLRNLSGWRVDVICGGFPCQDISNAGKRAGIGGERSGLWREFARVVRVLRPRIVVVENVDALASRGLDKVLGDLSEIGFDAEWSIVSACSLGASHVRKRMFVVAYAAGGEVQQQRWRQQLQKNRDSQRHLHHRESEPGIARVADGVPCRLDRIGAIGNAVAPPRRRIYRPTSHRTVAS